MQPAGNYPLKTPPKARHHIGTYITLIGVIVTLWAGVAGWIIVPNSIGDFFKRLLGWNDPKTKLTVKDTSGTWRANPPKGKEYVFTQEGQQIQVQLFGKRNPIGHGTMVDNKVHLTLWIEVTDGIRTETKMADLDLTLINENTLVGTFSGAKEGEYGTISFIRTASG